MIKKQRNKRPVGAQKGHIPWNKGLKLEKRKPLSKATKIKIGNANRKSQKRLWQDLEHRNKMSESHKGYKASVSTRLKMSKNMLGSNNHFWQGGIADYPYPDEWTEILRDSIRQRDNYICQECGIHQDELNKKLDVHHIDYDKNNLDPKNLISLCRGCHIKTNYNREYWIEHFNQKEVTDGE